MPKRPKILPEKPTDEKEPTSITIPQDLLAWARDHAKEGDWGNLSRLVVSLLKREKKEVERREGTAPDVTLKVNSRKTKGSGEN